MDFETLKQMFYTWMKVKVPGYGTGNADFTVARDKLAQFNVTKLRAIPEARWQECYDNLKAEVQHG